MIPEATQQPQYDGTNPVPDTDRSGAACSRIGLYTRPSGTCAESGEAPRIAPFASLRHSERGRQSGLPRPEESLPMRREQPKKHSFPSLFPLNSRRSFSFGNLGLPPSLPTAVGMTHAHRELHRIAQTCRPSRIVRFNSRDSTAHDGVRSCSALRASRATCRLDSDGCEIDSSRIRRSSWFRLRRFFSARRFRCMCT